METRKKMKSDQVFSLLEQRRAFHPAVLGLAAILAATLAPAAQNVLDTERHQVTFEQNGFFYGEEQYYVVVPPVIHVFDPVWPEKPEKYRHEVFHIENGKWIKTIGKPTSKPKLFLAEDLCDTDNRLDLPSGPLRNGLPPGVRIKDIEHHLDYAIVIYSDTPTQAEWYSLRAALMRKDERNGWRAVETIYAGDNRHYCGRTEFPVFTRPGEQSFILLLHTGETNMEDRNFADIQSFLVRKRPFQYPSKSHLQQAPNSQAFSRQFERHVIFPRCATLRYPSGPGGHDCN
jgi:hypothetical protein